MIPDDILDALIVLAFTEVDFPSDAELAQLGDELSIEDEMALDALGPDIVERILNGEWKPKSRSGKRRKKRRHEHRELAGAMNRDDGDGELTDEARAEMEKKIRELEENDETP
ncbi:hypothetical protein AYO40_00555 [Planctomycetaceae bacterium SCGC AG-212-D15]|nr:hypothetical protein AYO40_00555 [Planctomycetaceae bacterium SCGC AG-212-D15]